MDVDGDGQGNCEVQVTGLYAVPTHKTVSDIAGLISVIDDELDGHADGHWHSSTADDD